MGRSPETTSNIELPSDFHLLPGERLLSVERPNRARLPYPPSSLEQMLRLTNAKHEREIGKFGPAIAALALEVMSLEGSDDDTPEHLNLYDVFFTRDALRAASDLIYDYPELARVTVLECARKQGLQYNREREEEEGRIMHEDRDPNDPIAKKLTEERGWGWPYYGSVDATPSFIRTLAAYCQLTEENHAFLREEYVDIAGNKQTISHSLELALKWISQRLNSNSGGILEYKSTLPKGAENQVWKDSWDAYHHADGTLANHSKGIASIEVQVLTYDALLDAADLMENALDQKDRAEHIRLRAEKLKQAIFEYFWTEDKGGYFVLGTDRDENDNLRQLKIRTSNMGHTLNSRLLMGDDPEIVRKRQAVINHLMSPDMQNVSGIFTLAKDEVRFRPGSYQCGSVWLWENHFIANGMRLHGEDKKAEIIDSKIMHIPKATHMFPEFVRGDDAPEPSTNQYIISVYDEANQRVNVVEQPPQEVQAWTVAAILATTNRINRQRIAKFLRGNRS